MSNTKTIARNSGWYGLETLVSALVTMFTSIAIARTLGPTKMGYIIYVLWISSVVTSLGGLGIPSTTQKYMAEFLGIPDRGTARHIYFKTLLVQMGFATFATAGLLIWVLREAPADYRLACILIVVSIWPSMVNAVAAQANVATEQLSYNLPASIASIIVFFFAILATVIFHWGVVGVGASTLIMRLVDFFVRIIPTSLRFYRWERPHVHPHGLRQRMFTFAWQSVATMIIALIVWDRSEFILLKHLCTDIRQLAFYSVAFSMAERLLISSAIFGSATSVTIFAQYGRDKSRLADLTASSFRYLALSSIPVHFIAASLAFPALMVLYGGQYRGAAMVVTIAPLLCLPKAFIGPVQSLLQSDERQTWVIASTILAGVMDMSIAWILIPRHGAVGACLGSGAAQITAVGMMWAVGIYLYRIRLPWVQIGKIVFTSTAASAAAHFVGLPFPPLWRLLLGSIAALVTLLTLFYLLRILEPEDRARINVLSSMLPRSLGRIVDRITSWLVRPELTSATASNV
jgi:O-antigen/teichoic acid export membrane protein